MLRRTVGKDGSRPAFTLIELLVVVAIIALLISILLPSLARARELSKRAVCAANMKGMGTGFYTYANENNEMWPICNKRCQREPGTVGDLRRYGLGIVPFQRVRCGKLPLVHDA